VTYEYYSTSATPPNKGQLKSVASVSATATYSNYDALGRFQINTQQVAGNPATYTLRYTYWLNDEWKTLRYPSGRLVTYSGDDAGRVNKVSSGAKTYADLTAQLSTPPYHPWGQVAWLKFGNDLWATHDYRPAGSPTLFKLGTTVGAADKAQLQYNYAAAANNGNVLSHVISRGGADFWKQEYTYDDVNRLVVAKEWRKNKTGNPVQWSRTNSYDRFGNRWVGTSGLTFADTHEPTAGANFNKNTNRLNALTYDSAGNLLQYNPYALTYDAENQLLAMTSPNSGTGTFSYDGEGRRVKRTWTPSGGTAVTTYYLYDAAGRLATEYTTAAPTAANSVYLFTDLLGSIRAVSGEKPSTGTASVTECYDYLDFGRLLSAGDNARPSCYQNNPENSLTSRVPEKFTGKERDPVPLTNLDYFGARYYSGAQGRFTAPDSPFVDQNPSDPQSWNLYSYVRNNPLKYIDPSGRDCVYTDDIDSKGTVNVEQGNCSRKRGTFVNGTVDLTSLAWDPRKRTLGYSYSGAEGAIGAGIIGVSRPPSDALDPKGLAFVQGMAARVDASNQMIAMLAGASVAAGIGAGAYPAAAQWVNEAAFGPAMGRLFFEGAAGYKLATAWGRGRLISETPLGEQYYKWGEPLGRYGWRLLSRFWASGASGTANIFPSFTNSQSLLWKTELPILLRNPNVIRVWR
jgi:RHS repeat-associated protein